MRTHAPRASSRPLEVQCAATAALGSGALSLRSPSVVVGTATRATTACQGPVAPLRTRVHRASTALLGLRPARTARPVPTRRRPALARCAQASVMPGTSARARWEMGQPCPSSQHALLASFPTPGLACARTVMPAGTALPPRRLRAPTCAAPGASATQARPHAQHVLRVSTLRWPRTLCASHAPWGAPRQASTVRPPASPTWVHPVPQPSTAWVPAPSRRRAMQCQGTTAQRAVTSFRLSQVLPPQLVFRVQQEHTAMPSRRQPPAPPATRPLRLDITVQWRVRRRLAFLAQRESMRRLTLELASSCAQLAPRRRGPTVRA